MSINNSNPSDANLPAAPLASGPSPRMMAKPSTLLAHAHPVHGHPLPPGLSSGPSAMTLLRALKRRWLLASTLGLLIGAIAAGAVWWNLPQPKLMAIRRVRVLTSQYVIDKQLDPLGSGENFQRTQMALVKDRILLNEALNEVVRKGKLTGADLPTLEWLESHVVVEFTSPEIMQVALPGENASQLLPIVDEMVNVYINKIGEEKKNFDRGLANQLTDSKKRLEDHILAKRNFQKQRSQALTTSNTDALQIQQTLTVRELSLTRSDLRQTKRELQKALIELEDLTKKTANAGNLPVPEEKIEEALKSDRFIKEHEDLKAKMEELLAKTLERALDASNPRVKEMEKDIEGEKQIIAKYIAEQRPSMVKRMQSQMSFTTVSTMARLKDKVSFLQTFQGQLEKEIEALDAETKQINLATPDLQNLNFEISTAEASLKSITAKLTNLEIEMQNQNERIRSWGDPYTRRPDDFLKRASTSGVAGLGSFGLVLIGIAFLEFRSRKLDTTDEVVYGLGMPVVGTLPRLPSRTRRLIGARSLSSARWKGMLTESVDAVRTLLLHAAQTEGIKVVMVTSAVGGEGKTSLSCHLAASLARAGKKTILVDGDMRNPSCHRMFDVDLENGFSELLRGEIELADAVHETPAATLSVIPAGLCDGVALQSLAQGGACPIFTQLREQFDFVIIDSCPVLPVADTLMIGQSCDAVVFSLLRDVSRMPKVYAAYQRLAMLGIRMLGAVVNGTQESTYGSDYHYVVPTSREQAAV